jgi:hypothetical protein
MGPDKGKGREAGIGLSVQAYALVASGLLAAIVVVLLALAPRVVAFM